MFNERLQNIGFFILLGAATILASFLFWPFVKLLVVAGILAVLFNPWYERILKRTKSEAISGLLTVLLVLLIVLGPLFLMGLALFSEISGFYNNVSGGGARIDQNEIVSRLPGPLQEVVHNLLSNLSSKLSDLAGTTVRSVSSILSDVANFFLGCFLVFFSLYYFLRDNNKIRDFTAKIFPLSKEHGLKIVDRLEQAISGVVKGSFLVALMQGVVATVGFLIFGVPQPFLWGTFTVLAALVPTVGTSISLVPAVLYLLLTGHTGAGVGLAIWGVAAVGLIDNFLSPRIVGRRTNLHPLIVLLSVLGGLQVFGILGFLFGPLLMAVFVTLLDIYLSEAEKI